VKQVVKAWNWSVLKPGKPSLGLAKNVESHQASKQSQLDHKPSKSIQTKSAVTANFQTLQLNSKAIPNQISQSKLLKIAAQTSNPNYRCTINSQQFNFQLNKSIFPLKLSWHRGDTRFLGKYTTYSWFFSFS
jgi:hypothetical protein